MQYKINLKFRELVLSTIQFDLLCLLVCYQRV